MLLKKVNLGLCLIGALFVVTACGSTEETDVTNQQAPQVLPQDTPAAPDSKKESTDPLRDTSIDTPQEAKNTVVEAVKQFMPQAKQIKVNCTTIGKRVFDCRGTADTGVGVLQGIRVRVHQDSVGTLNIK